MPSQSSDVNEKPAPDRPIGVQALADQLNLSIGTISRALRQDPLIRASTRKLVQEAADAAGYIPNHQARLLRAKKTQRLGLMLPSLTNPVYAEKVSTAQSVAREKGYEIAFACADRSPAQEDSLLRHLISLGVDGLIVMLSTPKIDRRHAIHLALGRHIPVVLMGGAARHAPPGCSTLRVDTGRGRSQALEHLLSLGHRRIGFIGLPAQVASSFPQMNIFPGSPWHAISQMLRDAGIGSQDCEHLPALPGNAQSGYDAITQRLELPGPYPTAYMALDDQVAIGAMTCLQDRGWRVPEDVSIVGSDNTVNARFCRPCLTTLSQTHLDQGRKAVEMVLSHINDPGRPPDHMLLQPMLVVGLSTGPVTTGR